MVESAFKMQCYIHKNKLHHTANFRYKRISGRTQGHKKAGMVMRSKQNYFRFVEERGATTKVQ